VGVHCRRGHCGIAGRWPPGCWAMACTRDESTGDLKCARSYFEKSLAKWRQLHGAARRRCMWALQHRWLGWAMCAPLEVILLMPGLILRRRW
jgi:hypothetical protein